MGAVKKIFPVLAAGLISTAFIMYVLAEEIVSPTEPTVTTEMVDIINITDIAETESESTVPVDTEPFTTVEQEFETVTSEIVESSADVKPFTPDGQATVMDLSYESDGKKFYTFKTDAGNIFYLIIDHQRNIDNVYFLKSVIEDDLFALAENSGKKSNISAIPVPEPSTVPPQPAETKDNPDISSEKPPQDNNKIIFIVIGVAVIGVIIYYFKVIRAERDSATNNDDESDEDDSEDMEFEDEREE